MLFAKFYTGPESNLVLTLLLVIPGESLILLLTQKPAYHDTLVALLLRQSKFLHLWNTLALSAGVAATGWGHVKAKRGGVDFPIFARNMLTW